MEKLGREPSERLLGSEGLLINVAQLLKEHVGSRRIYLIDEIIDKQALISVKGKVVLIRTGRGFLVQGKLTGELELVCSRCLKNFLYPMSFAIEEEVLPVTTVNNGLAFPMPENPDGFIIDRDNMLDIGELIRQYALLNLPMKPLCQPDCAGIKEISSYGSTQEKIC